MDNQPPQSIRPNMQQNPQLTSEQKPPEPEVVYLRWQAPEFSYTNKPMGWYLVLGLFFIGLIVLAIIIRQWMTIALLAVMWIALAVYARKKPRMLDYMITNHGIHVGEKNYDYNRFSSYSENNDHGMRVFDLLPKKRLAIMVSLSVTSEIEAKVDQSLSKLLPKNDRKKDPVDKFIQYIKF